MGPTLSLAVLFGIAAALAVAARRWRVPYALLLVVAGLLLGPTGWMSPPRLSRALLYDAFLPGLIFEAAFPIEPSELRRALGRIVALALPGVVFGMVVTGALVYGAGRLGIAAPVALPPALVFAAIIAATDPIAVVAVFREIGTPRPLRVLVEGESLLNDGTSIVLVTVALALTTGGVTIASAALLFSRILIVGALIGGGVGLGGALVLQRTDRPLIVIVVTVAAAYGAFLLAERLEGSGVLATVGAALLCRPPRAALSRRMLQSFWERAAFGLARTTEHVPWSWSAVITWGGLRGALSMVLAFSMPDGFPNRDAVVAMTSGVVLLSLVLQGGTMGQLLRRLRIAT